MSCSFYLFLKCHQIPYSSSSSSGPSGLVWAVLYNGKAIVRTGVKRESPTGENWAEVVPPGEGLRIVQLSVGTNSVWYEMRSTNYNHGYRMHSFLTFSYI